jgi:hypothetical protein
MKRQFFIKIAALCGIIFPILSFIFIFLLGAMIPGYNPLQEYISEIWAKGSGFENIAFLLLTSLGIICLIFSFGLYLEIEEDKFSYYNLIVLSIFSVSLIFLGIFPCQYTCESQGFTFHLFFTIIACITLGFSPLLFYFLTKKDKRWKEYEHFSLISFFASFVLLFYYTFFLGPFKGLIQRSYFFVCFLWIGIISIKLFKLANVDYGKRKIKIGKKKSKK